MAAPATPAGLSVQPTEGGLKVGCSVTATATTYQFRHSTDESTWTTRTAVADNFETIASLLYTTSYYVQVRASNGDGDSAWSASVQGQPYIDVDAEFATLYHGEDVSDPADLGDLGPSYETDDWVFAVTWSHLQQGIFQSLLSIQGNASSGAGLAGAILRINTSNEIQALVKTTSGTSYSSAASSTSGSFTKNTRFTALCRKSGTSLVVYDEDGNTLASATLPASTMDWVTSTSLRTTVAAHWATSVTPNLDAQMMGWLRQALIIPGGTTTAERDAILRWLKGRYHTEAPSARVDLFVDAVDVDNDTTSGPTVLSPTRQGQVLEGAAGTYYEEFRYVTVFQRGPTDWLMWATCWEYDSGSYVWNGAVLFTSTDGLTWSAPNLGLITYDGNTNNGLFLSSGNANADEINDAIYDEASPVNDLLLLFGALNNSGSVSCASIYEAASETVAPTLYKNAEPALDDSAAGGYIEAKTFWVRNDGRLAVLSSHNHGADERSLVVGAARTTTWDGDWQSLGEVAAFNAPGSTTQFYHAKVQRISDEVLLAFVTRYNSTSGGGPIDLYVSRDDGLTWTSSDAAWFEPAASGWDDEVIYPDRLHKVGDTWRLYYTGIDTPHDTAPKVNADVGYATLGYRRLAQIATTGTVRSTALLTSSDTAVSVNADGSGGDVTVAVLDASDNSTISGYGGTVSADSYGSVFLLPPHREVKLAFTLASGAVLYSYEVGPRSSFPTIITGTVNATLEPLTADLSGTIIQPIAGTLNATLEPLTANLSGVILIGPLEYYTDFSEYPTSEQPADWTHRQGNSSSRDVVAVGGATGGKVVRISGNGLQGTPDFLSWDEVPLLGDCELVLRVERNQDGQLGVGVVWRGGGYWLEHRGDVLGGTSNALRLYRGGTTLATTSAGSFDDPEDYFWLRVVDTGGVIQAKMWSGDREDEPTTGGPDDDGWALKHDDSAHGNADNFGYVGIVRSRTNGSGGISADYDIFQAEGDEALAADTITATVDAPNIVIGITENDPAVTGRTLHRSTTQGFTPGAGNLLATLGADTEEYVDDFLLPGTTYYYRTLVTDGTFTAQSNEASATTPEGNAPELRVGAITDTTATLSVDPLSEYLQVEFRTYVGGVLIDSGIQSGSERFTRDLSGLDPDTEHESWARVEYEDGWSAWDSLTWSTIAFEPTGEDMGCPPLPSSYLWNPDSNPIDGTTRRGLGWFRPLPGEPLSGQAVAILRWYDGGQRWDIEISDDQGETWTTLVEDLPQTSADLDGLETWEVPIDTTLYADGQDYRLRATSTVNERVITSLTFPIDNAGQVRWWTHRGGDALDGRFGKLWTQEKTGGLFGDPGDPIWVRGWDGGIGAWEGHNWALYADRDVPACLGADATIRFYIWSGEGGLAGTQGRDDTETFDCGIGFFASGMSAAEAVGIVVGTNNGVTYPIGCCDDLYTSTLGKVSAIGRSNTGQTFSILGALAGEGTVSGGGDLADVSPLRKWFFKSCHRRPLYHFQGALSWLLMRWRHGNQPGHLPQFARTCGRRYEMYALRARVEVNPADHSEVTIKTRLDGIGVDPPDSGYWHSEKTVTMAQAMTEGAVGLVSRQFAQGNYPQGVRVFMSSSILPLEPGDPIEVEPDEPPPFQPPQEGAPCSLVLQVYEPDRETVAWEVGTDPDHVNPYLSLPEHYGEQEIDVVNGAATIGQVEVIVIDKAQTAGDQDSGWLTERMSDGAVTALHGRRCRLIRYISEELGWVVIADGPASSPQLDSTYAAYRWTIRDTRETERKVRAFVAADTSWLVPMGVEAGWYYWVDDDGDDNWLVEPTDPLFGEYRFESAGGGAGSGPERGRVLIRDTQFWPDGFQGLGSTVVPIAGQEIDEVAISESVYQSTFTLPEVLGDPLPLRYEWADLEILWRVQGSGDPWTVVQPTDVRGVAGESIAKPRGTNIEAVPSSVLTTSKDGHFTDDGAEDVRGVTAILLRGHLAEGSFPDHEAVVEVAVRYKGPPNDATPLHIEFNEDGSRKTTGQLLKELYDGVYGYPDVVTGEPVPTGIRYDPAALEQMTDYVYLRVTEPVSDARAWAEEHIYAPTGWVPALDNDGRISPVSQVPPETFDGLTDVNNAVTEPVPNWNAGERIVNDLRITYPRYYQTDVNTADSADKLVEREVEIAFRDNQSILEHGEQSVSMALHAFASPGDEVGRTRLGLVNEPGYQHAQNRNLYVFDRFKNGAQVIEVPVMRSVTATLRAGDWVTIDLSWFPDYLTRRRGMATAGQIIAIHDVDCAWRILLIEEALPPVIEEES